jgi:hypothetical protein
MSIRTLLLILALLVLGGFGNAAALTIEGTFIGGQELGPSTGGGDVVDAFRAAAQIWEHAIKDKFTVHFDYGWGTDPGGYHFLLEQGGTPNRETRGLILVNPQVYADGSYISVFLDPTPKQNNEFPLYRELAADLGGGPLNISRTFQTLSSEPQFQDLVSMFLHEIGHGLGMSNDNWSFMDESADGNISIGPTLPCAGMVIPLALNNYGVTSHLSPDIGWDGLAPLMGSSANNTRVYPSALDILAIAQISGFRNFKLDWRGSKECR